MFDTIVSSILQVIACGVIPAFVILIGFRKKSNSFVFLGQMLASPKASALAAIASLLFSPPPLVLVSVESSFKAVCE